MSKKEGYVELTVKLPKRLVDFLKGMEKTMGMSLEEFIEHSVVQTVGACLDSEDLFVPSSNDIIEKYGLEAILKEHCALPYIKNSQES